MFTKATKIVVGVVVLLLVAAPALAETHWEIQAVDNTGHAVHPKVAAGPPPPRTPGEGDKITLTGIVLNNPEDMLDGTYDAPAWIGGQWQIFVQGEGDDHAGTACWIGQKYGNMGDVNYTQVEWNGELDRLNYNGTSHKIRMGDRVRIVGYSLEYGGKSNINERHTTAAQLDFSVEWLGATPGLPAPEMITLADVKDASDNDIFNQTRLTGGEYYQARLVRINNVSFSDPNLWGPDAKMKITDGTRTLTCRLGMSNVFNSSSNLAGTFDVVGIFNQEDGWTDGYQIWVMGYDGSSDMLGIVPEPTCVTLMGISALALLRRRRDTGKTDG